jgi:hypothetical protein
MGVRAYEFRFAGEADRTVRAAFSDFDISVGDGSTLLRARLLDQAAVHGTLDRISALGLELIEVRSVDASSS